MKLLQEFIKTQKKINMIEQEVFGAEYKKREMEDNINLNREHIEMLFLFFIPISIFFYSLKKYGDFSIFEISSILNYFMIGMFSLSFVWKYKKIVKMKNSKSLFEYLVFFALFSFFLAITIQIFGYNSLSSIDRVALTLSIIMVTLSLLILNEKMKGLGLKKRYKEKIKRAEKNNYLNLLKNRENIATEIIKDEETILKVLKGSNKLTMLDHFNYSYLYNNYIEPKYKNLNKFDFAILKKEEKAIIND